MSRKDEQDKYACFQWIRDVRSKMNGDMENMTPEERVAYSREGAEKALRAIPKLSLEEARRQRQAILYPEEKPQSLRRTRPAGKPAAARRRRAAKRPPVHA